MKRLVLFVYTYIQIFFIWIVKKKPFKKIHTLVTTFLKWDLCIKRETNEYDIWNMFVCRLFKAMHTFFDNENIFAIQCYIHECDIEMATLRHKKNRGEKKRIWKNNKYLVTSKWFDVNVAVSVMQRRKRIEFEQQHKLSSRKKNLWFVIFCGTFFARLYIIYVKTYSHNTISVCQLVGINTIFVRLWFGIPNETTV